MSWYAIRTVYLFDTKPDGINVFEERIVCFEADTVEAAYQKACRESDEYEDSLGFESYPLQEGYEQDGAPLIDGYELWSQLFESKLSLEDFYRERYERFKYLPPKKLRLVNSIDSEGNEDPR
jgi:hypothetical protein